MSLGYTFGGLLGGHFGKMLDPSSGITVKVTPQEWVNPYEFSPAKRYVKYFVVEARDPSGRVVGKVDLWPSVDQKGGLEAGTVFVEEDYRRKGIATAMYIEAQKVTGLKIFPSKHRTEAGKAFWTGSREQGLLSGLPKKGRIPASAVDFAMKKLERQVKRCGITKAQLREGMAVEREHQDVTKGGIERTARIAAAHLCERKDYYKRLKRYVE